MVMCQVTYEFALNDWGNVSHPPARYQGFDPLAMDKPNDPIGDTIFHPYMYIHIYLYIYIYIHKDIPYIYI